MSGGTQNLLRTTDIERARTSCPRERWTSVSILSSSRPEHTGMTPLGGTVNDTHLLLSRNCHGTNASRKASGTDLSQICLPCVTSNAVRTFPCVSDVPEHAVLSTDGSEHASHDINDPSVNVRFGQVQSICAIIRGLSQNPTAVNNCEQL